MVRVELTPAACALNSIHFLFAEASFDLDLWGGLAAVVACDHWCQLG